MTFAVEVIVALKPVVNDPQASLSATGCIGSGSPASAPFASANISSL